jgi:RHS repeat-associated protein
LKPSVAPQTEIDRRFYALVTDHIDTPVGLLDPTTGTLAGHAHASMWGQTTWTGTDTPWRYPGQYHDPETGLHYNHHRYYQPHTGRYLSPDPLGLAPAPNPYGYVGNPTSFVDPFGLNPCPESDGQLPDHLEFPPTSHGFGVNDPPSRLYGPWTQEDLARMMNGTPPRSYGFPHLHHADQMPGAAIHEVPQEIHRRPELHPNRFNQGVTNEMR